MLIGGVRMQKFKFIFITIFVFSFEAFSQSNKLSQNGTLDKSKIISSYNEVFQGFKSVNLYPMREVKITEKNGFTVTKDNKPTKSFISEDELNVLKTMELSPNGNKIYESEKFYSDSSKTKYCQLFIAKPVSKNTSLNELTLSDKAKMLPKKESVQFISHGEDNLFSYERLYDISSGDEVKKYTALLSCSFEKLGEKVRDHAAINAIYVAIVKKIAIKYNVVTEAKFSHVNFGNGPEPKGTSINDGQK